MTWYHDTPHTAMLQAGSNLCVCGNAKSDPIHWVPKCTADRRCMSVEHDRNCPQAIAKLAAEDRMRQARKLVERDTAQRLTGVAAASAGTVRDDYPALTVLADAAAHLADEGCPEAVRAWREVARLRQWKAEAIQVLDEWEDVWKAAGSPSQPGHSKAAQVRRLIEEWTL